MKFSVRQILASATGAVLAAVIASLFGVKGTIIGVAIGSIAATSGTALVAQSIERGHKAVQQVVVRVPDRSTLLRRLGGTLAAGSTDSSAEATTPLAEETTNAAVVHEPPATEAAEATAQLALPDATTTYDDATEALPTLPVTRPQPVMAPMVEGSRGMRWPAIAGTAAIIFVLSLAFVTTVELIAGRPLADLFGAHLKGANPSIVKVFENTPPAPTTTTVPPTTTTSSSSTTTTSSTSTTTSTTVVGTTSPTDTGSSTTTTGGTSDTTTTTTSSSGQ
jgi:hypothetical protein